MLTPMLLSYARRRGPEETRRRKFAEPVAHHLFRYIDGQEFFPVMYRDRMPDEIGEIIDARAHVLITFFSPDWFMACIFR